MTEGLITLNRPGAVLCAVVNRLGPRAPGCDAAALALANLQRVFLSDAPIEDIFGSLVESNREIFERSESAKRGDADVDPRWRGMGATADVVIFESDRAHVAHVGDGFVFVRRGDELKAVTTINSLANEYRRQRPNLPEAELAKLPKNVIVRALGMNASLEIDRFDVETKADDVWFVCSGAVAISLSRDRLAALLRTGRTSAELARDVSIALKDASEPDDLTFAIYVISKPPSLEDQFRDAKSEAQRHPRDDDAYWKTVSILQKASPADVLELLLPLASDPDPRLRSMVPDTLRYLGGEARPFIETSVNLFRDMLRTEQSPEVIESIGLAFVDISHPAGLELMLPFASHSSAHVRKAVVHALLGRHEKRAIDTLIGLSNDGDADIRNWATFGIGSSLGEPGEELFVDSEEIRIALIGRLSDAHDETRAEALVGLAIRRDARVLSALKAELNRDDIGSMVIDAAFYMASSELCEALAKLKSRDASSVEFFEKAPRHGLSAALAACGTGVRGPAS